MPEPTDAACRYTVCRAPASPEMRGLWDGPAWGGIEAMDIARFHPDSSDHRPRVQAKLAYTDDALHVHFRVEDRYVVARHTQPQGPVCRDSCVELFVAPVQGQGYFNLEINCGGTILLHHNRLPRQGTREVAPDPLRIYHNLPERIEPEITDPTAWQIECTVPLALFEEVLGVPVTVGPGACWRGNLYKCADDSSHPHWASWAPLGSVLDFHCPDHFGELRFA